MPRPSRTVLRRTRAAFGMSYLAVTFVVETSASANEAPAPRTSALSWVRGPGAESCLGVRTLAQAVERILSRPVFVPASRADLSVEARVDRRESGGFYVHLNV